jgi:hypothetical protein
MAQTETTPGAGNGKDHEDKKSDQAAEREVLDR